ncbi:trans-aconitate 2-methyltransferase [Cyanobium sp. WAJ14-Wanaka]|uniref:class I SAM-dependent methyltransferase n=1 Tax=Cyanobium sp. WAJ14-Wanaka TaxID=2823725 RepID=UPI0020CC648B|nr:class I SAM-dependent methyltransferase [Cyanobium sp. WAJ14-Wanaka]MCP9776153.1 class I SAM-dependent methyltransferase [Cyanobium sp. WAJ14-Wanaka]
MDFFNRQWSSYRAVVEHDLMEHQAVATATALTINDWLAARPGHAPAATMLDLGCGDLALLAPLLKKLPLGRYTGLDLAAVVLPLAAQALGTVPYPSHWREGDLLGWSTGIDGSDPALDQPDILHSAFAIHHLSDGDKERFLGGARRRIQPGGMFLWVDVFREPGETRQAYIDRYVQRITGGWQALSSEQKDHVINHLSQFDMPADREAIQASAEAAGWHWHWAWQGKHRAEAMALLTPA